MDFKELQNKVVQNAVKDVVGMVIINAHLLGIDLEEAIDKKWINKEK